MSRVKPRRSLAARIARAILLTLAILIAAVFGWSLYVFRDRDPAAAFSLDVSDAQARANPRPLRAGFSRVRINPDVSNPQQPVYLAGFSNNRIATAIHDDLWAAAVVIDDGYTRLGIVSLDAIGLFHEDVTTVRRRIPADAGITYAIVCSTHNHNTPDLMGLWGRDEFHSGVDPAYRDLVVGGAARAITDAAVALEPARLALHEIPTLPNGLVHDTRRPIVFDPDIRVMHFTRPRDGSTIGTVVGWADHPETLWSQNTEITADYCGYLRDGLAEGIREGGSLTLPGLGGTHVFVNGAIGGLMTTSREVTVRDPFLGRDFVEPSHEKARALGRQLVSRIVPRLREAAPASEHAPIAVRARTIEVRLDNVGFLIAPLIGVLDRGHSSWMKLRTEVAVARVGDAGIACVPGEIYPEIVNGGVERAPGGDFDIEPAEVPPLRQMMPGRVRFIFGLANDEIGYIIPKSEWDRRAPYIYGSPRPSYGEVVSVGPETAPAIHAAIRDLCRPPWP